MNEGSPDDDLVFLWKIIKKTFRWIAILVAVLFVYAVVFRSNTIVGWWKFYQLCKAEGGARFYEPVERNVGWLLEEKNRYPRYTPNLFYFDQNFVRFENIDGEKFDAFRVPPPSSPDVAGHNDHSKSSVSIMPADESKSVRYVYRYIKTFSFDWDEFITLVQVREKKIKFYEHEYFEKQQESIVDNNTQKVVATHTKFFFKWRNPAYQIFFFVFEKPSSCPNFSLEEERNFSRDIYQKAPFK